jgi:hypothetical protein
MTSAESRAMEDIWEIVEELRLGEMKAGDAWKGIQVALRAHAEEAQSVVFDHIIEQLRLGAMREGNDTIKLTLERICYNVEDFRRALKTPSGVVNKGRDGNGGVS